MLVEMMFFEGVEAVEMMFWADGHGDAKAQERRLHGVLPGEVATQRTGSCRRCGRGIQERSLHEEDPASGPESWGLRHQHHGGLRD